MTAVLQVNGLSAAYGKVGVLHDIDLTVNTGEVHAVIGANGAGKTTFLRAISGFGVRGPGKVTAGEIKFAGRDIAGQSPSSISRSGVRIVPEQVSVFLPMSVGDNLRLSLGRSRGQQAKAAEELKAVLFELFPVLDQRRHQRAGLLSGGERQMLGISMGLLEMPQLLLIDEASIGLSPAAVRTIFGALRELRTRYELTILLVEQNLDAALTLADTVHVMRGGQLVYDSAPGESVERRELYGLMTGESVDVP